MLFSLLARVLVTAAVASQPTSQPAQPAMPTFNKSAAQILEGTPLRTRNLHPGISASGLTLALDVGATVFGDVDAPTVVAISCNAPFGKHERECQIVLRIVNNLFPDWHGARAFLEANGELVSSHKVERVLGYITGGQVEMTWSDELATIEIVLSPR